MEKDTGNKIDLIEKIPKEIIHQIFDNPHESLMIIDEKGHILFMSKSYERMVSFTAAEAVGKHIKTVLPHSELPRVIKTGKTEYGKQIVLNGEKRIIARVPIKKNGRVIGAYGKIIFWNMSKLIELNAKLNRLKGEITQYRKKLDQLYNSSYSLNNIIGDSELLNKAKTMARQVSETDSTVLIIGESGTGKELFSHAIHNMSKRKNHPFVSINCSCIPSDLAESELFGYAPGAFSGASPKGKIGKFEMANKGTIFLDEIGELPLNLQAKLLRVLEGMVIEKVGGKLKKINCRVLAATNRDLEEMVNNNTFRSDLFYRLNVFNINLPPLRKSVTDIPLLVRHFINKLRTDFSKDITSVSSEAMEILMGYSWPGNIRELSNTLESAFICCNGDQLKTEHLPSRITLQQESFAMGETLAYSLKKQMQDAEKEILKNTLRLTGHNKTIAAKLLEIHRTGLHQKIKKYNLDPGGV